MEVLDFIKNYGSLIASALTVIFSIIFLIIKRSPKSVDEVTAILHDVATSVPFLCEMAERPGEGSQKKKEVVSHCLSDVRHKLKRDLSSSEVADFTNYFGYVVESVLEAPSRKR